MRTRLARPVIGLAVLAAVATLPGPPGSAAPGSPATGSPATGSAAAPALPSETSRLAAPIVLTGEQLPAWSGPAATGVAEPYPSGAGDPVPVGDKRRTAHNGRLVVPPATGIDVGTISAWAWAAGKWQEVPVQVDQRFPYFLANGRSGFGAYSGTDQELTYAWNPDAHSVGEESWKKIFGSCRARYALSEAEVAASPFVSRGPEETLADYTKAMADPVPTLDADDEVALQARDAGALAPAGTPPPAGALPGGQTVRITDPIGALGARYLYLFAKPGGSRFNSRNGAVKHVRSADADEYVDKFSFPEGGKEVLGTSNGGYGPNVGGAVCRTATKKGAPAADPRRTADGRPRISTDRFPRDGMTITTPSYRLHASGRWMVRSYQVDRPGPAGYGADLIDRWKGRAFQQSPDSTVSLVGFEDEQVNWEANAALLGWRAGAVRVIRAVWGADSGTNTTKTETYYRDTDVFRYRVRVHPIPPDGLYTSWDYNPDVAAVYYNPLRPEGVPIDGRNDETGNVDAIPVTGQAAFADACDPTFDTCSAFNRSEEVAGKGDNGGAVYTFEPVGAASAGFFSAVPYYRDDACLDDGTGDQPVPRPWPGESSADKRVADAYVAAAVSRGAPRGLTIEALRAECAKTDNQAAWGKRPFQGAFASHGVHFFAAGDTDNAMVGAPLTEIDAQSWRYAVPMSAPRNATIEYGANVTIALRATTEPYSA